MEGMTATQTASSAPAAPPVPAVPQTPGAATGGVTTQTVVATPEAVVLQPPPYRTIDNRIPEEVIPLMGMVMTTVLALAIGYPIVRTVMRIIERRSDRSLVKGEDVAVQLRALQDSVDTMAIELERISEAQRYSAKLLAEKSAQR